MKVLLSLSLIAASTIHGQDSRIRGGHTHDILEVRFNADATRLVSYSWGDGWLILWDVGTGRVLWQTKTNAIQKGYEYYTLSAFAFSSSEDRIASGSGNGTIQLWDAQTGHLLWRADAHSEAVTAVALSPDGTFLASAGSLDGKREIITARTIDGQVVRRLEDDNCTVVELSFVEEGHGLRAGKAGGAVVQWDLETGIRSSIGPELPCQVEDNLVHARFSSDNQKLVRTDNGDFIFSDLKTKTLRRIKGHSRTGSTIDLSPDGALFVEGGSWGDAAIWITETRSGKSRRFDGHSQRFPACRPSVLEIQLLAERQTRQKTIDEIKARRNQQAAVDILRLKPQVFITFEHFGEMVDPGQLRLMESGEPDKSQIKRSRADATAAWLRLHNASPLPIQIPTPSLYFPNPECFYEYAGNKKLPGLCDGREIGVWYGLEDKKGQAIPYGFDFGAASVLLPGTSVLFPTPLSLLKGKQSISFGYSFLKETGEGKIDKYGEETKLKFRETDLPSSP